MMKKINGKQKRLFVSASLLIVALVLVVTLYSKLNSNEMQIDRLQGVAVELAPQVDDIQKSEIVKEAVTVAEIEPEKITISKNDKVEVVVINEPIPTPPEKPKMEAPESKPQTNDDLEDMANMPEYTKEELMVETEEVIIITEEQPAESNLVPPSENPFLNPANVAKPIELNGSDLGEGEWGTGDKF